MQDITVICSDLLAVLNASVICVYEKGEPPTEAAVATNATLSDTDPSGAVRFTIAVVLLYGVGVIGLLGITARRNRRVELMDKEVNKFLKMQHQSYSFNGKTKRRKRKMKAVDKLIAALHFQDNMDDNEVVSPTKRLKTGSSRTLGMDIVANKSSHGDLEETASMTVINETVPSIDSYDISHFTLNGPSVPRNSNVSLRQQNPPLCQNQISLEGIEEENKDEYLLPERSDGDSDFIEEMPV